VKITIVLSRWPDASRVDLADHAVIRRLEPALFLLVGRRRDQRMHDHHAEQRMLLAFLDRRRGAHRGRHVGGRVHRVVGHGCEIRRMRSQVREVHEPRFLGERLAVDVIEHAVGEIRGLRVFLVVLRAPLRAVRRLIRERAPVVGHVDTLLAQPRDPILRRPFGQVALGVEPGQHAFVRVQGAVAGGHRARVDARIGVAEQCGRVPEAPR
jgi:hypothetical protein